MPFACLTKFALILAVLSLVSCGDGPREATAEKSSSTALVERRGASEAGAPLFEKISSAESGITFANLWDPSEEERPDLSQAAAGGGVAMGDFDGDGLPELVLTRPHGGPVLYRNRGDWRFEEITEAAGLGASQDDWVTGPSIADADGDGDLDLFLVTHRRGHHRLYLNDGSGTFAEAKGSGLELSGEAISAAWADFDNDGDLDVHVVTNWHDPKTRQAIIIDPVTGQPKLQDEEAPFQVLPVGGGDYQLLRLGSPDHLFRNNGDGTFTDVAEQAGLSGAGVGLSSIWWDADADGWPDLYVSNDYKGADRLYMNRRDGTFVDVARESLPHTPWFSMGTAVGDLDGNGFLDLMATDMAGSTHYRSKIGMGDMSDSAWFLKAARPPQYMRNALYLGTGTRHFREGAQLAGLANTDWTWTVKIADLDNDGLEDVFFTNGMTRDWNHSDLEKLSPRAGEAGYLEFWYQQEPLREQNLAFRNLGDLRFEENGEGWGLDDVSVSHGAAAGDLDGDGDLDLVVNRWGQEAAVYRNASTEGKVVRISLQTQEGNRFGIGSRVEAEIGGRKVLRFLGSGGGFMSSDEPVIHFGVGEAAGIDSVRVIWPGGTAEDFGSRAAGRHHFLTRGAGTSASRRSSLAPLFVPSVEPAFTRFQINEVPFDDYARQPLLPATLDKLGPDIAWGDLDGDGDEDLVVSGPATIADRVFANLGGGRFAPAFEGFARAAAASETSDLILFDADGDGDQDLFTVSGGVEGEPENAGLRDRLYLNDGRGNLRHAPDAVPDVRDSGSVAAVSDLDGDGDLDLFVGGRSVPGTYPTAARSRLYHNEGGRFVDRTPEALQSLGMVTDACWSDVDGDGREDLFVTIDWGSPRLFLNRGGRLEEASAVWKLEDLSGWWQCVRPGDFDGDGDIDLAVGNMGLNTKYRADPDHPVEIYFGDLDGSGRPHLVEAAVKGDALLPIRGRSCSAEAMPSIASRFENFHSFASATLGEIYSPVGLENALRWEITELRSGVLRNEGGSFQFVPFPRAAQIAPVSAMVAGDLDGDGLIDLALAQNFFGNQPETGRYDGGIGELLLGRGDGSFLVACAIESGISIKGDGTDIALADVDGDGVADLVVARSEEPLAVYLRVTTE